MIQALFTIACCTMILVALFAMPVVEPLSSGFTDALAWIADMLAWADRFVDVPTALMLATSIFTFELTLLTMRFVLFGIKMMRN
jgi:type II secretory pathway component PulF